MCDTCGGEGWVPVETWDDGTTRRVAPCPDCRPAQRSLHDGGHFDSDHDRETCDVCVTLAQPPGRRRRARQPALTAPQLPEERRWWDR